MDELKGSEKWIDYNKEGETFTNLGAGLTGRYYIFVKSIKDNVGNSSKVFNENDVNQVTEVIKTKGEHQGTYHRFGPYLFDNSGPLVSVAPNKTNAVKSQEVTITVKDQGDADLNDDIIVINITYQQVI